MQARCPDKQSQLAAGADGCCQQMHSRLSACAAWCLSQLWWEGASPALHVAQELPKTALPALIGFQAAPASRHALQVAARGVPPAQAPGRRQAAGGQVGLLPCCTPLALHWQRVAQCVREGCGAAVLCRQLRQACPPLGLRAAACPGLQAGQLNRLQLCGQEDSPGQAISQPSAWASRLWCCPMCSRLRRWPLRACSCCPARCSSDASARSRPLSTCVSCAPRAGHPPVQGHRSGLAALQRHGGSR